MDKNLPEDFKPLTQTEIAAIEEKIKDAISMFFSSKYDLKFFGMMALKFDIVHHVFDPGARGYVQFDIDNLRTLSDGAIHLNDYYLRDKKFTGGSIIALVLHELFHILHKHGLRRGLRDNMLWNVACDHVVDRTLRELLKSMRNNKNKISKFGDFNIVDELDTHNSQCTEEEAYEWLKTNRDDFKIEMNCNGVITVTTPSGKKFNVNGMGVAQAPDDPNQKGQHEHMVEKFLSNARTLFETMGRGTLPGGMSQIIENLIRVETPWEIVLEKALRTHAIVRTNDRSWKMPHKKFMSHGIYVPGTNESEEDTTVGICAFAVDSSGSMSTEMLRKIAYVVKESIAIFKEIHLYVHDVDVKQEKEFDKYTIDEFDEYLQTTGIQGRGGTSHKPLFNLIETKWNDDIDFKNNLSIVLCATDGYSDLESIYKDYKWIRGGTPIIILVPQDGKGKFWSHNFDYSNIAVLPLKES